MWEECDLSTFMSKAGMLQTPSWEVCLTQHVSAMGFGIEGVKCLPHLPRRRQIISQSYQSNHNAEEQLQKQEKTNRRWSGDTMIYSGSSGCVHCGPEPRGVPPYPNHPCPLPAIDSTYTPLTCPSYMVWTKPPPPPLYGEGGGLL